MFEISRTSLVLDRGNSEYSGHIDYVESSKMVKAIMAILTLGELIMLIQTIGIVPLIYPARSSDWNMYAHLFLVTIFATEPCSALVGFG